MNRCRHHGIEILTATVAGQAKKGRRKVHTPTNTASHPLPPSRNGSLRTRPTEDVVYQIVTVAAILIVLGTTLWVF